MSWWFFRPPLVAKMTVRDDAAHKPEAQAKDLRWRFRLVQPN
jgi:hypothetical protein